MHYMKLHAHSLSNTSSSRPCPCWLALASVCHARAQGQLEAQAELTRRAPQTALAISRETPSCASVVEAPRWGVQITSGRLIRGLLAGGGSLENTSRAACATAPLSRARSRASSFTTPPLATLTMRAPLLILAKAESLKMPCPWLSLMSETCCRCLAWNYWYPALGKRLRCMMQ